MTSQEQIHNWLVSAFNNGQEGFSEFFYYDRLDHEFFSILLMDYFMFDENFNIATNVTTSYSPANIKTLATRMKRISQHDPDILSIPLANSESQLQDQISTFLTAHAITEHTATIWLPEDVSIQISLDDTKPGKYPESPGKFK